MLPGTSDQLTALLAAIVAKVFDGPTELQDLLNQLAKHLVEGVAERIDRSRRAVSDYLESEAGSAGRVPLARRWQPRTQAGRIPPGLRPSTGMG